MLPIETLKEHYKEYATRGDDRIQDREKAKKSIVKYVINKVGFKPINNEVKVVVLGASDERYLPVHQRVFEGVLQFPVKMITFDVDTEHLGGTSNTVIKHDATNPFPNIPYDIVFSHELMKFLTSEEQITVIKNSHQALKKNGIAMHILHEPSIKGTPELRQWQNRVDPDNLIRQLKDNEISATKLVFDSDTDIEWARETTVIVIKK